MANPTLAGPKTLILAEYHCELLARAVLYTRVSYFTKEERGELEALLPLLGYKLKDGKPL